MTYQQPIEAPAQSEAKPESRLCPNCGGEFAKGGRGMGRKFCSSQCRISFANRAKAEGAVIITLVKAHHQLRHAKPDTREAEVCNMARRELAEIMRMFIEADEEAGRPPLTEYVGDLLAETLYVDRTRKF